MKRRDFVRHGILGGIAVTIGPSVSSCKKNAPLNTDKNTPEEFELEEFSIPELQDGMRSGLYTAVSITEMYLSRIEEIDKNNMNLKSVLEVNPDALAYSDETGH